jgi:hypothetical protein
MDRGKTVKWSVLLLIGAFALFALWKWPQWRAAGEAGSAYAARITCSCRYVDGRSAESCARDIEEDAGLVSITEKPEEKAITGSVPLLGRATARFRAGYGCLMEPK